MLRFALVLSTGSGRLSQHQWQDRGAPSRSMVDFDVHPVVQVHPKVLDIVGVGSLLAGLYTRIYLGNCW